MCSKNEVLARRTRPETAEPRPNAAFPRLDETRPGVLLQSFNEQNAEEHRGVPKARFCCTWNHGNMRAGRRAARYRNGAERAIGVSRPGSRDRYRRASLRWRTAQMFHVRHSRTSAEREGSATRPFPISERPRSPSSSSAAVAAVATAQPRQLIGSRRNRTAPAAHRQPSQPRSPFPAILPAESPNTR